MESITKRIINILKIILLTVIIIIIILVSMLFFKDYFTVSPVSTMQSIECTIKDKEYPISEYYILNKNDLDKNDELEIKLNQIKSFKALYEYVGSELGKDKSEVELIIEGYRRAKKMKYIKFLNYRDFHRRGLRGLRRRRGMRGLRVRGRPNY